MIDKEKQYRTRDGREVRIYATDGDTEMPIHGAIKTERGWEHYGWGRNGGGILYQSDLIEIRPRIKREYWVNVSKGMIVGYPHKETLLESLHRPTKFSDACVKVVIDCEDGEGL